MIASWMMYCVIISAAVGASALLAERAIRLWRQAGRWVWFTALGGVLAFAALPWILPAHPPAMGDSLLPTLASVVAQPGGISSAPQLFASVMGSAASAAHVDRVLWAGWLASVGMVWVVLGLSWARLRWRRRDWSNAIVAGTPTLISDDLGPAVIGFFHPIVVLPRWAFDEEPAARSLILSHETSHIRAHDQRLVGISLIAFSLMAWNPLLWIFLRRLRSAIELDCDDRVLRGGADPRQYGALLLRISLYPRPSTVLVTALAEPISYLERRVKALSRRKPAHRTLIFGAATFASVFFLGIACTTPRPSRSVADAPDPIELSVVGATQWLPRPEFARQLEGVLAKRHPRVYARGQRGGEAVWIVVDRQSRILDSWVGAAYSEAGWRRFREEGRFPGLALTPWIFSATDATGRPLAIVWAQPRKAWKIADRPAPVLDEQIADAILLRDPSLTDGRVAEGQAIWVLDHAGGKEENFLRNLEIWVAPATTERKSQWEKLRARAPKAVDVLPHTLQLRDAAGTAVPVIYGVEDRS
jgi:hypothetical protein